MFYPGVGKYPGTKSPLLFYFSHLQMPGWSPGIFPLYFFYNSVGDCRIINCLRKEIPITFTFYCSWVEGYPNISWQFPTYHLVSKLEWIAQSWQIFGTVSCCLLRKDVVLLNEKDEEEMIRLYLSCTCFHPQHPSWDQDVLQHYWNLSPDIQLQFYTINICLNL